MPRRLDAILAAAGVQPRPFRALLHALALMDFRSQQFGRATNTGAGATITPLFWVVGQYLLVGGVLSIILFARVDAHAFALLNLAASMALVATAIITEFNEVVLSAEDLETIGHLPVPLRTYAAARMTNLLAYVLLITAALNVTPAIIGLGLRDTNWAFLPAYACAALIGNLMTAAAVIGFYTIVLRSTPGAGTRDTLAWAQIVLLLVIGYGGQLIFKDTQGRLEMAVWNLPGWVAWLPPAWLARFVDSFANAPAVAWAPAAASAALAVAFWAAAHASLSRAYARMQPGHRAWQRTTTRPLPAPGSLTGPLTRRLLRPGPETAAFWLVSTMLRRDADLRMRTWPAVAIVVAPLVLGLLSGQFANPLAHPGKASALAIAAIYLLAAPWPSIVNNLGFSRHDAAAWVLHTAPTGDLAAVARGVRTAVTLRVMAPLVAAIVVAAAVVWRDPVSVALHAAAACLVVAAAGYATVIGVLHELPLSRPLARGQSTGPVSLWSAILTGGAMFLALGHALLARHPAALLGQIALLAVLTLILRHLSHRALARRTASIAHD